MSGDDGSRSGSEPFGNVDDGIGGAAAGSARFFVFRGVEPDGSEFIGWVQSRNTRAFKDKYGWDRFESVELVRIENRNGEILQEFNQ